jgi:hypothetical protein
MVDGAVALGLRVTLSRLSKATPAGENSEDCKNCDRRSKVAPAKALAFIDQNPSHAFVSWSPHPNLSGFRSQSAGEQFPWVFVNVPAGA